MSCRTASTLRPFRVPTGDESLSANSGQTELTRHPTKAFKMLGRAVDNYQPAAPKREPSIASQVVASQKSSPAAQKSVDTMLKGAAASKNRGSIGGWAEPTTNARPFNRTISGSSFKSIPGTYSTEDKRPYSTMNQNDNPAATQDPIQKVRSWDAGHHDMGVPGLFANARENAPGRSLNVIDLEADVVDLTQDEAPQKSHIPPPNKPSFEVQIGMDEDFGSDSEIDLDVEYALPLPKKPTEPLQPVSVNRDSTQMLPPEPITTSRGLPIPSSATGWSSSPVSHWEAPSLKPTTMQAVQQQRSAPPPSSEPSIDANPRPAKRRTTPWAKRESEMSQRSDTSNQPYKAARLFYTTHQETPRIVESQHFEAPEFSGPYCHRCQGNGHVMPACPHNNKNTPQPPPAPDTFTPLPKDEKPPWNATAGTMREQQKAFKEQQRLKKAGRSKGAIEDLFGGEKKKMESSKRLRPAEIFLSKEQQNVLNLVTAQKKSVFFTGSAGTGKSVLMRAIISDLQRTYRQTPENVAVTASTGLAACNIGGVTLHSFAGIGLGKESVPELVKKIMRNNKAKQRWLKCKVLVIDEISMVDGELFDKLEGIARLVKKNARPFGGIQLVVTGDFFQLPPVPDFGSGRNIRFAFDADTWQTSVHHTIGLTEVFRQRDPGMSILHSIISILLTMLPVFANMLNEMRLGKIPDSTLKAFRSLDRPLPPSTIDPTELFPTRNEVDRSNTHKMAALKGKGKLYVAEDGGTIKDKQQLDRLLANIMAPKMIELKKGAQVMLIKNMDEGLVNGSLGRVTRFATEQAFGMFVEGKISELYDSEDEQQAQLSQEAKRRIRAFGGINPANSTKTQEQRWPVVAFVLADGTERELLVQPEDWKVELPNGEVQAQRRQLPLILAWALSIHKAQGQTLERVKVDLKKVFENGQAYVALSRATTQEGLWVKNFNAKAVMAHPRVGEFYESLYSVNKALKHPTVKQKPKETGEVPDDVIVAGMGGGGGAQDEWDEDEEAFRLTYG